MQITRGNYSNQHAREIIGEEMEKISKITSRSALAATYLEEHKSRGTDEIPENLSEKMYDAIFSLYRKFLKSSEIVYNRLEIKNDITKERRGLRHDVVYEVFCFGLG